MGDESALLAGLRTGDEDAFTALVHELQPRLLCLAQTLVGSRAVAEEVVQDTWLAVVRGIKHFEGRSSLKTWVFHILVNRARTAGWREHRAEPLDAVDLEQRCDHGGTWMLPGDLPPDQADDRLMAERLARRVGETLPSLPCVQREVVVLRYFAGFSAADVARRLGITMGHERVLLHRARARLKHELAISGASHPVSSL